MKTRPHRAVQPDGKDLMACLPFLVQQDITIHCPEEKMTSIYAARVLEVGDRRLRINLPRRLAGSGYLRSSRAVILIFVIGEQLFRCAADYQAEDNHKRELIITGEIEKTTRRFHVRYPLQMHIAYVPVSDMSLARGHFVNLRWKKSMTLDLSAGGALLQIPFQAPVNSYLLMNMEIQNFRGPFFVFGQVRWFGLSDFDRNHHLCGVRFILREELSRHFSDKALSELPKIMLPFDKNMQNELDDYLGKQSGDSMQGENDGC